MADRLPEGWQHVDGIKAAAEEGQRRHHQHGNEVQLLEIRCPDADDEAEQAETHSRQHKKQDHHERMGDADIHEERRGYQDDRTDHQPLCRRRSDIADKDFRHRHRCGEDFIDGAGEFREVDAEGAVADALRQKRQHDEAGRYESAIGNPTNLLNPRTDRCAEHDKIERGGNDRRDHALQQGAAGARHFEQVDGLDGFEIHFWPPTSETKISSSELCRVEISLKWMLAAKSALRTSAMRPCSPLSSIS